MRVQHFLKPHAAEEGKCASEAGCIDEVERINRSWSVYYRGHGTSGQPCAVEAPWPGNLAKWECVFPHRCSSKAPFLSAAFTPQAAFKCSSSHPRQMSTYTGQHMASTCSCPLPQMAVLWKLWLSWSLSCLLPCCLIAMLTVLAFKSLSFPSGSETTHFVSGGHSFIADATSWSSGHARTTYIHPPHKLLLSPSS